MYISFSSALFSWYKWLVSRITLKKHLPCGLVARIPGFHPGGPGSIPGMGKCLDCQAKKLVPNYSCERTRHIDSNSSGTHIQVPMISTVVFILYHSYLEKSTSNNSYQLISYHNNNNWDLENYEKVKSYKKYKKY